MKNQRIRLFSLLLAVLLFAGSVLALSLFNQERNPSLISDARAEDTFKTLKKGSAGETVRRAQQALYDLGYYDGPVSGNFSKVFESAVKIFQQDFGIPATGALDWDTYSLIISDLPEQLPEATRPPKKQKIPAKEDEDAPFVIEGEWYSDKEHVAAYLFEFDELPENYITKKEAGKYCISFSNPL